MSKSIVLMRHAKSSWAFDLPDDKRPLKTRGINDAKLVSKDFKKHHISIDKAYCSHATRAFETCKILHKVMDWDVNAVGITSQLYDFGGDSVLNFISQLPKHYNTVMIFGHNHAFTSISNQLGSQYIDNLPTSGLVKIDFESTNWQELKNGKTKFIIIPKLLRNL